MQYLGPLFLLPLRPAPRSPLLRAIQDENVNGMTLLKGEGNRVTDYGLATEDDVINTIWVLDSNKLPFYQAEVRGPGLKGTALDHGDATTGAIDSCSLVSSLNPLLPRSVLDPSRTQKYHQMHNGIGKDFGKEYRVDLKRQLVAAGTIKDTGCPDY